MEHAFVVKGMTCGHCEKAVTQAIRSVDPQAKVTIDRTQGDVRIESEAPRDRLATAIVDEGYTVAA